MHITSLPLLAFLDIIDRNLKLLKYFNPDAILDAIYYVWIYNKHCKLKSLTLYFYSILRQINKIENQTKYPIFRMTYYSRHRMCFEIDNFQVSHAMLY